MIIYLYSFLKSTVVSVNLEWLQIFLFVQSPAFDKTKMVFLAIQGVTTHSYNVFTTNILVPLRKQML